MLGKLFKYEFKSTAKVMFIIYGILMITTVLASSSFSLEAMEGSNISELPPIIEFFFVSAISLYVLSIFALFVVSYVYLCIHFYRTMYSEQGYLTHTLPVKPVALFNVKLITSLVWMLLTGLLFALSVFSLLIGVSHGELLDFEVIAQIQFSLEHEFVPIFGMPFGQFVLYIVFLSILSCLSYLLMVFASISIGQLFTGHKIAGAFAAGIVLYVIQQTIGTIIMLAFGLSTFTYYEKIQTFADILLTPPMIVSLIVSILFTIAFYIVCIVMQTRHLNLD